MKKFYLTTPIYYVNAAPHIGHAYTTVLADVLAAYYRQLYGKDNVYFLTGTDEHGAKVAESAAKQKLTAQAFTDQVSQQFKDAWQNLEIGYDDFIRTTDKRHQKIVQEILIKLKDKGVLYEADYEGLYCIGCEKFISESELIDGKCPDHNRIPEIVKEKNWFFNLQKFLPEIAKQIKADKLKIVPSTRKNEVLGLIKQGIPDFSISRSVKSVPWGIDLPWDKNQKAYVWVDALPNYITALDYPQGEKFKKFWPADVQFLGLEIIKFHALYWPAILLALGLPLPKMLAVHGFFTIDGKKMSKTLGNVIHPDELVKEYGAEATKYLLLSQFSFGHESDIKVSEFTVKYNADLVNGLGNLVNRVTNMVEQYLEGKLALTLKPAKWTVAANKDISNLQFREALLKIWEPIHKLNEQIDKTKPWELAKDPAQHSKLKKLLTEFSEELYSIAKSLQPFLPSISEKIIKILTAKKISKPKEPLFKRK